MIATAILALVAMTTSALVNSDEPVVDQLKITSKQTRANDSKMTPVAKMKSLAANPAKAAGAITAADVAGEYAWDYYSYLNPSGAQKGSVVITATSETEIEIVGFYSSFPLTATVAADGTITIPNQFMFTNTYYDKDVYFMHDRWADDGSSHAVSEEPLVGSFADGQIAFDDYDNITIQIPDLGYFLFAGSNSLAKEVVEEEDPADWEVCGTADLMDGWILTCYGMDQTENIIKDVVVEKNVKEEGVYRLVNPYQNEMYASVNTSEVENGYIKFNIADPEFPYVYPKVKAGFANSNGEFYCYDLNGYYFVAKGNSKEAILANIDADELSTFNENTGVLTIPTAMFGITANPNAGYSWQDSDGNSIDMKSSIKLNFMGDPNYEEPIEPQDDQINFKERTDLAVSGGSSTDGDITEDKTFDSDKGLFTMTVSPSTTSTPNRVWEGPQLRVCGGDITINAIEGYTIKNVTIAGASGNWNKDANYTIDGLKASEVKAIEGNVANAGKLVYNCDTKQVKIDVKAQVRIDVITLTLMEDEPLYKENGVVGAGIVEKGMPFFNTPVKVAVYGNKVVIKGWDGTKGSDLNVYYTEVAQNDEVSTVITGIEQVVNGEVVSEVDEIGDDETIVRLYPQSEVYPMAAIYVADEMTGLKLEEGMGQLSLMGQWQPAANLGGDDDNMGVAEPIEAAYMVTWPGEPMELPAELVYEAVGEITEDADWAADEIPSLFPDAEGVKVSVYDNNTIIVSAWAGTEGYDLKVAYDAEEEVVTALTPIVNGVEGQTYTSGYAYLPMNAEETFVALITYSGYVYSYAGSDAEAEEGYVFMVGFDSENNLGHYNLTWPQTPTYTLAELKAIEVDPEGAGIEVKVAVENAVVTLYNATAGLGFVQDAEVGIAIATDPDAEEPVEGLAANKALTGVVKGTWMDMGVAPVLLITDITECEVADAEVAPVLISDLEELAANDCRLVKIENTEATPLTVEYGTIYIGDDYMASEDFLEEALDLPEAVKSVTGIAFGGELVYLRGADDVEAASAEEPETVTYIVSWESDMEKANAVTTADGVKVQITGNESKQIQSGNAITLPDGSTYTAMKVSNGAQNTITLPTGMLATKVTFYSYVNKGSDAIENARTSYWKEVAGVTYTEETASIMTCPSDRPVDNPDIAEFEIDKKNSFTFTNAGEQVVYVAVIEAISAADGIQSTVVATVNNGAVYNLAGQKVNANFKGIVVKNGKAVVVK